MKFLGSFLVVIISLSQLPKQSEKYRQREQQLRKESHGILSEDDINYIVSIACLSATGMSIQSMQEYLGNVDIGAIAADDQIKLLEDQNSRLHASGISNRLSRELSLHW